MSLLSVFHSEASVGWGGQEIRILTEMAHLRDRGHAVGLIAQPGAGLLVRAREAGFPTHTVRMRGALDFLAVAQMARILRAERAGVLSTHSSVDAWVGGWAARWLGLPVVRTRHLTIRLRRNPLSPRVYSWMADHVVTTAEEGRTLLIEQAGIPPDRVSVIPTGVEAARFDPSRVAGDRLRAELGIPEAAPVVGVVAVLRFRKGHGVLLAALASPPLCHRPAHLILAGAGPMEGVLRAQAASLGLMRRVHFLGHREDVPEILAASTVVVLPSTMGEGVPQTILQALALARPVVASDVPGVRQVVRDRETGLLVPPEEPVALAGAILHLLDHPRLARDLGEAGRRLVLSAYTVDRMTDAMEAVYRRMVAGPCASCV